MRALKSLIYGTLVTAAVVFGLGHDIAENAGVIKGDGLDHIVPAVRVSADTITPTAGSVVIADTVTGDERALPPPHSGTARPAAFLAALILAAAGFGFWSIRDAA
jgi:hypothetical protein